MVNNVSTRSFFYFNSSVTWYATNFRHKVSYLNITLNFNQFIWLTVLEKKIVKLFATDCVHFD